MSSCSDSESKEAAHQSQRLILYRETQLMTVTPAHPCKALTACTWSQAGTWYFPTATAEAMPSAEQVASSPPASTLMVWGRVPGGKETHGAFHGADM